jgi:hypothetical protein
MVGMGQYEVPEYVLVMYAAVFRFPLSSTTNSVRASKVTPAQTITETLPKLTFGMMLH